MASPASEVATIQLTAAIRSGLSPARMAPFSFSAEAVVTRPNRVWRLIAHRIAASTTTMAPSISRSWPTSRPNTRTLDLGRTGRTVGDDRPLQPDDGPEVEEQADRGHHPGQAGRVAQRPEHQRVDQQPEQRAVTR